jgi:hypothetical protein
MKPGLVYERGTSVNQHIGMLRIGAVLAQGRLSVQPRPRLACPKLIGR